MAPLQEKWEEQKAKSAAKGEAACNAGQSPYPSIRKKLREDVRLAKDGGALAGGGVVATAAGTGIALFGLGKLTADTFTGFFNQKAPKRIAVAALAAAFIYGAAQEELGIPSLGDMYKGGKDWVISLTTSP